MTRPRNYAFVEDGIVTNIIWLHPDAESEFVNAVPYKRTLCVRIGDTYSDGNFYHDGVLIDKDYEDTGEYIGEDELLSDDL